MFTDTAAGDAAQVHRLCEAGPAGVEEHLHRQRADERLLRGRSCAVKCRAWRDVMMCEAIESLVLRAPTEPAESGYRPEAVAQ